MQETVVNVLTGFALSMIGYVYMNSRQEKKILDKQLQQLNQTNLYLSSPQPTSPKILLNEIKQTKNRIPVAIVVPTQNISQIQSQTFSRTFHNFRISNHQSEHFRPYSYGFMLGEVGGEFSVKFQGQQIKVDIRECNIHENLMIKQSPVRHDPLNNQMPVYESVTYSMKAGCSLVIVGALQYNIQNKQLLMVPSFLLQRAEGTISRSNLLAEAYHLLQSRLYGINTLQIIYLAALLGVVYIRREAVAGLWKSLTGWIWQLFGRKDQGQVPLFSEVRARESDQLRCECGQTLNMVYGCGHLSICEACHEKKQDKLCRLCGVRARKFWRIFT